MADLLITDRLHINRNMAQAPVQKKKKKKNKGKSNSLPQIEDIICPELDTKSWFKLGINLGFDHDKLSKLQQLYKNDVPMCSKRMIQMWKQTVVKHTIKIIPLLYQSLQSTGLGDLAERLRHQTKEDKNEYEASNQEEIWESLIQDLNKVSFSDTDEEEIQGGSIIVKNCSGVAIGKNYIISTSQASQELEKSKAYKRCKMTIFRSNTSF